MIRFLSLVAAAWFGMPVIAVAQTAPAGAGPVPAALITDENARMQAVALSLGGPVNYISAEESVLRDKNPSDPARAWELWKAHVTRKPQ